MGDLGLGDRRLDRVLGGDVGMKGDALHFCRDLLGVFLALVDDADFGALGGHGAGGGRTQARATTGDENGNVFQLHDRTFPWAFLVRGRMASNEWRIEKQRSVLFAPVSSSPFTTR